MAWTRTPTRRSCSVNGELVRYFRQQRRWTQEDLAAQSGYSLRLVAKAEAGGALHPDTIEVLAATLDAPQSTVAPEDLICDPLALAQQFVLNYAHYESEMIAASEAFLAPHLSAWIDGDPNQIPFAGEYQSIDEVDRFFHTFFRLFERPDKTLFASPPMLCQGNHVVAWGHEQLAPRGGSPFAVPGLVTLHMSFERGRLVRFEDYYTTTLEVREFLRTVRTESDEG